MTRSRFALAALAATALAAGGQPAAKETRFRVAVASKLTMGAGGQEQKMEADAAFEYVWKVEGKERTLVVEGAEVRAVVGGRELMYAKLNRAGFTDTKGGKTTEIKTEDAPPELRGMLTDSFGTPICKIELDAAGKEVKRTVVARPGATQLIDSGMIANATLFHPWYAADKDEWLADTEVSTGNGLATGKLTYTKVPGGKGGQAVKVSGTLSANGIKGPGGLTIKDGKYKVVGEQIYDPERKEWVAGKWTMDVAFTITDGTKDIGGAQGEMQVTFGLKPAK